MDDGGVVTIMFRVPHIFFGVCICLLATCSSPLSPPSGDNGDTVGVGDSILEVGAVHARVRNESAALADVTLRFLQDNDVAHVAFVRVPPATITTIAGPQSQQIELSGVNELGEALASAKLTFGVDFDESRAAEYVIRADGSVPNESPGHTVPPSLALEMISANEVSIGGTIDITWADSGSSSAVISWFLRPADDANAALIPLGPAIGAALDGLNDSFTAVVEGVPPGDYDLVGRIDDGGQSAAAGGSFALRVVRDPANAAPAISLRNSDATQILRNGESVLVQWTDSDADDNATILFSLVPTGPGALGLDEFVIGPPIAEDPDSRLEDSVTLTLHDVLPGLYDLVARIDDGRLAGTDRLVAAIRVLPSDENEIPRLSLIEPNRDFEITKGGTFTVRWTDSDANDNARISLLLDSDPQTSLLNGNEIVLASAFEEDPDGAGDQISVVIPPEMTPGFYYLVSVISDGATQVISRAPALVTVRAAIKPGGSGSGGGTGTNPGGPNGGGDGIGHSPGAEVTLIPSAEVVNHPGELITVLVSQDVGPSPRRSRVFLSNVAYGGTFEIDVTPVVGPAPSTKSYTIVVDSGVVPNQAWPRSFDILVESIIDGVSTRTSIPRPIWIRQEVEVVSLRMLNYVCDVADTMTLDSSPFVGVEWSWYGGGFGGDELYDLEFWLSADGIVPEKAQNDPRHKLVALTQGSPNIIQTQRVALDELRGISSRSSGVDFIQVSADLGLDSGWYWLVGVFDRSGENLALPRHPTPIKICHPVDVADGSQP